MPKCIKRIVFVSVAIIVAFSILSCGRIGFNPYPEDSESSVNTNTSSDNIIPISDSDTASDSETTTINTDTISDYETATADADTISDCETATTDTDTVSDCETATTDTADTDTPSDSETTTFGTDTTSDSDSLPVGTCFDGVLNQDETEIDCGGSICPVCETCFDDILNQDELRVDCGGTICPVCPACLTPFNDPEEITSLGTTGDLYGPNLSRDSLTLYFAEFDGVTENILKATRTDRSAEFSAATPINEINTLDLEGSPFISYDELTLYFYSTRPDGVGERDLWFATRANSSSPFDPPQLTNVVNALAIDHLPYLSTDERTLFFTSFRMGGLGQSDIWTAQRSDKNSNFDIPINLGEINTDNRETSPWVSGDGRLIFFISNRTGGLGSNDIWMASRPDVASVFDAPTNVVNLNSVDPEYDVSLSYDEQEVFFSSVRGGNISLWKASRECQQQLK